MSVSILVLILFILIVAYICIYLIGMVGLPAPIDMLAKAIVVIISIVAILTKAGLM